MVALWDEMGMMACSWSTGAEGRCCFVLVIETYHALYEGSLRDHYRSGSAPTTVAALFCEESVMWTLQFVTVSFASNRLDRELFRTSCPSLRAPFGSYVRRRSQHIYV